MATLKEIALRANVSIGTVDRVLHRRGRVSLETAQRVKKILKDLDYKPNILARSLSLAKTFNFATLLPLPDQDGKYWELPQRGIEKAQRELDVYKVKINHFHFDKYSEASFEKACNALLSRVANLDGLLLAPVLSGASTQFLRRLPKRVQYVFIDSYLPESRCLTYIGEDSFQSGVLSARLMDLLINSAGKVVLLRMALRDFHIEERLRGFESFFKNHTNVVLKSFLVDARDDGSFRRAAEKIARKHPQLAGIFTPCARCFEVADWLKNHQHHKIFLIGYDLVGQNISFLREGIIDFLISQRPDRQGYEGLYNLFKIIALDERVEPRINMPLDIVTKENLSFYLA